MALKGSARYSCVVERGQRQDDPAKHGPPRSDQQPEQNNCFEGDIGSQEVGDRGPHPNTQRERDKKEGQQSDRLPAQALLSKEQAPERFAPGQHAGHRRQHAQLDQQRDQNELVRHPTNVSRQPPPDEVRQAANCGSSRTCKPCLASPSPLVTYGSAAATHAK